MDENSFYRKEMARLEREQKGLVDQYNSEKEEFDPNEYVRRLRAGKNIEYGLAIGEKMEDYYVRLQVHVDLAAKKNIQTHVGGKRGCWFTHEDKFGVGCFMCEDMNMVHYLMSLVGYYSHKYPKDQPML